MGDSGFAEHPVGPTLPACAPSTIRPPSEIAWAPQIVVEAA